MGSRDNAVHVGARRGRALTGSVLEELRRARLDRGLAGGDIARAAGLSPAQYSRVERGLTSGLSIELAAKLLAAVGLDLAVRAYPAGEPLRDAAHVALIDRLRRNVHRSLRFRTEVPFPAAGDRRAWDAVIEGPDWRHGVEAETRPRDRQALERRLALKLQDGDVTTMSLLLLDSRHNRDFVRANRAVLIDRFPIPGPRALEMLRVGLQPPGNAIVLL